MQIMPGLSAALLAALFVGLLIRAASAKKMAAPTSSVAPLKVEEEGESTESIELDLLDISTPHASFEEILQSCIAGREASAAPSFGEPPDGVLVDPTTGEISWETGAADAGSAG